MVEVVVEAVGVVVVLIVFVTGENIKNFSSDRILIEFYILSHIFWDYFYFLPVTSIFSSVTIVDPSSALVATLFTKV